LVSSSTHLPLSLEINEMDEDAILAVSVFVTIFGCTVAVLVGNLVCPPTRPKRGLSYLEDDDFV
jgi:hypothetical protein